MSYVFVTVGSTYFDELVKSIDNEKVLSKFKTLGYDKIIYQIGHGKYIPTVTHILPVEYFKYKTDISSIIRQSSLVICHAGVGTVMETLRADRPIIVVLNISLMDNHQSELADVLMSEKYVIKSGPQNIFSAISLDFSKRTTWEPAELSPFNTLIQNEINIW